MPHFQYTAVDGQGKTIEGTVMAATLREVSQGLRQRGLKVSRIVEAAGAVAPAQVMMPAASAATVTTPQPAVAAPVPPAAVTTAKPSNSNVVRTRTGTNKHLFLLFSQLANYLKSGIAPHQAFGDLQHRIGRADYVRSLADCQAAASAGKPISDTLERYPDLYPPHVVGLVRAGEQGGFLPQAVEKVAEHATTNMRWARPFWIVTGMVSAMLVAMPLIFVAFQAALDAYTALEKTGGFGNVIELFFQKLIELLIWPFGPIILMGLCVIYLISLWWRSLPMRPVRHRVAMTWPIFSKRSAAEGATMFSWSLSNLSRAGILPYTAWPLAVETVPNVIYKERLKTAGRMMHERTPLSEALARSKVLPNEVLMMVQTGETTGHVPGALHDAAEMTRAEFEGVESQSRKLVNTWVFLLYAIGGCFYLYILYRYFYPELVNRVIADPDTLP